MTESRTQDWAGLLEQVDWVRSLARHLTADAHAADDLAQDTLTAALVRPPPEGLPLRAWLAGVLRNLMRQTRREAGHRSAREHAAARTEETDASGELLERLDSHRAVVEAVTRLDEPYRSAILLRYFEGLAPAAIAARTGAPLRTVHTRLQRALARLRADLDRTHGGDSRAWLLALIPYARGSGGGNAAAFGALVMETKLKLGLAALALVGVCTTFVLWRGAASEAAAPLAREAVLDVREPEGRDTAALLEQAPTPAEHRTPELSVEVSRTEPTPSPARKLTGQVVDVERVTVAGLRVCYRASEGGARAGFEAVTDASGAFALDRPEVGGTLEIATPGWTSLFQPAFTDAPGVRELVLVVAKCITLGGRVMDEQGRGIESARVAIPLPFRMRARFDAILDGANTVEREVRTRSDGSFELAGAPLIADVELVTEHSAYHEERRPLPGFDDLGLEIVLRRFDADPDRLLGRVIDPAGDPVEDAWVGLGDASVKSGAQGEFALGVAPERRASPGTLRAVKAGYLPAELVLAPGAGWPATIELQLGSPPLAIRGRVVDARGEPVPGAEVWTDEETHFGYVPLPGGEMSVRAGASVEGLLRGDPWTFRVRTDSAGRFELGGLLPRDYRLRAFDRTRLALATATVAAEANHVELRLPDEERYAVVAGRVTNLAGEPLVGVRVELERPALGGGPADLLQGRGVDTDADGRFRFEDVARAVNTIRVVGSELGLPGYVHRIEPGEDVEHLELAAPQRVHARIEAGSDADFDHVAILDARGEKLGLSVNHGEHSYLMEDMDLDHGRSESFSVSELATTLVLYAKGAEVRRIPITLAHGELNTLRP